MLMARRPPLFAGVDFYHPSDCPMRAVPEDLISKGNYGPIWRVWVSRGDGPCINGCIMSLPALRCQQRSIFRKVTMKALRLFTIHLLCLTVGLTFLTNITQGEDAHKATEVQTQPSQGARFIQFVNDQLTVKVKDVSLQELLEEIARQGGLTLVLSGSLADRITIEFHQLPLEEGLRRILPQRNFAVEYSTTSEQSASTVRRPTKLWIFSKAEIEFRVQTTVVDGNTRGDSLIDVATDIRRLQVALTSEDPGEREDAVDALGESGRPEAVAPLRLALADEDEDVREAAIAALTNIGGEEAAQALAIALQDEDSSMREEAVEALGEIGGDAAAQALAIALQDQDSSIRETAVEALGEIGGESAIRLLEQALADEDESVRDTAAEMLEQMRSQIR